jgi:hypothetical protein
VEVLDGQEPEEFIKQWRSTTDSNNLVPFSDIINDWTGWYRDVYMLVMCLDKSTPWREEREGYC